MFLTRTNRALGLLMREEDNMEKTAEERKEDSLHVSINHDLNQISTSARASATNTKK